MKKPVMFLLASLLTVVTTSAFGQVPEKHPRVAELEGVLLKDASDFLKGRFPDVPFLVTVAVDPMRRQTSRRSEEENLPYMRYQSEEIQDEWDDPNRSNYELIMRSRKIGVKVSVPDTLREVDLADIKESMVQALSLVPGRDEILIQPRNWTKAPDYLQWALGGVGVLVLISLMGLAFMRSFANKIAGSIRQAAEGKGGSAAMAPPPPAPVASAESKNGGRGMSGDVTVSDPIRVRKALTEAAQFLAKDPLFPSLEDMIIMDQLGRDDAQTLGAFLVEFPIEIQKQIFAYSTGHHWMEAFVAPGDVSARSLEIAQRLARQSRVTTNRLNEDLAIALWRLDKDLVSFLKEMDSEVAFSLLKKLPKGVSLANARKAFPGTWGQLLDPKFKPVEVAPEDARVYLIKATQYKPWNQFSALDSYRQDRELLKYLSFANPSEERDIYEVSAAESFIHSVRPPFYKVLDQETESLKELVGKVSLDQWALALFNVDRPSRRKIETHLSEKQRFMLVEKLKSFDQRAPSPEAIASTREIIGRIFQQEQGGLSVTAEEKYEEIPAVPTQNAA